MWIKFLKKRPVPELDALHVKYFVRCPRLGMRRGTIKGMFTVYCPTCGVEIQNDPEHGVKYKAPTGVMTN